MDAYSYLRQQATQKRDATIANARAEYHEAVNAIERLRAYLGDSDLAPKQKRFKPLLEAMADAIPQEGVFTFEELLQRMAINEPARALNSASCIATTIFPGKNSCRYTPFCDSSD